MRQWKRDQFAADHPGLPYPASVRIDHDLAGQMLEKHLGLRGESVPRNFIRTVLKIKDSSRVVPCDLNTDGVAGPAMAQAIGPAIGSSVLVVELPPTGPESAQVFAATDVVLWLDNIWYPSDDMAFVDYPGARWVVILLHAPTMFVSLAPAP